MKRISWRNNKIISLKLKNEKFCLLQLLDRKGWVIIFNLFREENQWNDIELSKTSQLFTALIHHKSIFQNSEVIYQKDITPIQEYNYPSKAISLGSEIETVTLWKDTIDEREVSFLGAGQKRLITYDEVSRDRTYEPIKDGDYNKFKNLELSSVRLYPEFNERLRICSEIGENIDPTKELAFNQELDLICATYVDIISGRVRGKELGY